MMRLWRELRDRHRQPALPWRLRRLTSHLAMTLGPVIRGVTWDSLVGCPGRLTWWSGRQAGLDGVVRQPVSLTRAGARAEAGAQASR